MAARALGAALQAAAHQQLPVERRAAGDASASLYTLGSAFFLPSVKELGDDAYEEYILSLGLNMLHGTRHPD